LFPVPIAPRLTVAPSTTAPGSLVFRYDASGCNAADHVLIVGELGDFRTATTVVCSIGRDGTYTVTPPAGDLWFLIAGVEGAAYSSLGQATTGERFVSGVPEACATIVSQNTTAICP
jgi:hypothetical protein